MSKKSIEAIVAKDPESKSADLLAANNVGCAYCVEPFSTG